MQTLLPPLHRFFSPCSGYPAFLDSTDHDDSALLLLQPLHSFQLVQVSNYDLKRSQTNYISRWPTL